MNRRHEILKATSEAARVFALMASTDRDSIWVLPLGTRLIAAVIARKLDVREVATRQRTETTRRQGAAN